MSPRNRASAKKAGTAFESLVAAYLAATVDDRIERRARTGAKDRGDISGLRGLFGKRIVVECKDVARADLPGWVREAALEAGNDDAIAGVVVAKRRGTTDPADQWVHMTLADLVALLTGERPLSREDRLAIAEDARLDRTADAASRGEDQ
jgi:hypothetical protein